MFPSHVSLSFAYLHRCATGSLSYPVHVETMEINRKPAAKDETLICQDTLVPRSQPYEYSRTSQ